MPGRGGGINSVIRWQQINWHNPLMSRCSDKIAVREYVRDKIGEKYLIPMVPNEGVCWDNPDDIDFSKFPERFVLKSSNGSGMNIIVKDKSVLDIMLVKEKLHRWLITDFSRKFREEHYSSNNNYIYCEKYIEGKNGHPPEDYKIMCSNGTPLFAWVDLGRFVDHRRDIYSVNWVKQNVSINYPNSDCIIGRPTNWSEMLDVAAKLSEGIPLVRIDLYNVNGEIYFGEMTFTSDAGTGKVSPMSFSLKMANMINLSPFME